MVAFAANSLFCRAALGGGHVDAATFTSLRLASGAVILVVLARMRGQAGPKPQPAWGSAAVLFAYAIAFSLAYRQISAGVGALLLFAAVQLTMIVAGFRVGERPRLLEWIGLALSMGGLVLLTLPGLRRPDPVGAGLMLAAGVGWGLYSLRGRGQGDAVAVNAASFARAVPLALVANGAALGMGFAHLTVTGILLAAASGALASGLGYAIWYAALQGLTATRAAVVQLSVPPLAATAGVLFLGEAASARLVVASVLVLGGIALAVAGRPR